MSTSSHGIWGGGASRHCLCCVTTVSEACVVVRGNSSRRKSNVVHRNLVQLASDKSLSRVLATCKVEVGRTRCAGVGGEGANLRAVNVALNHTAAVTGDDQVVPCVVIKCAGRG